LNKVLGEGFHLLSFDPRGVKDSIPQAKCFTTSAQRTESIGQKLWNIEFEAGQMYTKADNIGKACADTTGEHGSFVNTPQTAADMNSILDAIGQDEMYYWGFSCKFFTLIGNDTTLLNLRRRDYFGTDLRPNVPRARV
jgi:pimeloyl-ACP methyl ester carboxylesterase